MAKPLFRRQALVIFSKNSIAKSKMMGWLTIGEQQLSDAAIALKNAATMSPQRLILPGVT